MQILIHKRYQKARANLTDRQKLRVKAALDMFIRDSEAPKLRLHQLKGKYHPQFSISAGGDLRIHFLALDKDRIMLITVGSHSQLYG